MHQGAHELSQPGWKLKAVSPDNGIEFRSQELLGVALRKGSGTASSTLASEPQLRGTSGADRPEECSRPTVPRSPVPNYTAPHRDLVRYLRVYNL